VTVSDYATRAVWDQGHSLDGRSVRITGFVTPGSGNGWYLTRMQLSCCAADATAIKIEVRGASAPAADTWVRLVGTWVPAASDNDGPVAVIQAKSFEPVDPPTDPYE